MNPVPFPVARLADCRNVVVVAPHPDDEAIGAFALMRALRRRGSAIWVVIATDGAASHPGSRRWPPARLVPERRRETRRAMATLGIPPHRIRFVGLRDGTLETTPAEARRRIAAALRRMPAPDLLVGPLPDDAHADHRVVAAALAGLLRGTRRRLGYPVWPLGRRRGCRLKIPLDGPTLAAKRRVLLSYRTQTGRITDAEAGMAMRAHHLRAFAGPYERFRALA